MGNDIQVDFVSDEKVEQSLFFDTDEWIVLEHGLIGTYSVSTDDEITLKTKNDSGLVTVTLTEGDTFKCELLPGFPIFVAGEDAQVLDWDEILNEQHKI